MLVRVKKTAGNYGHTINGAIVPRNYETGAFEVTDEKAAELVARGIVDVVGASTAPATETAAETESEQKSDLAEMTIRQLRTIAKERGMKGYLSKSKAELLAALTEQEEQEQTPQFDQTGGTV